MQVIQQRVDESDEPGSPPEVYGFRTNNSFISVTIHFSSFNSFPLSLTLPNVTSNIPSVAGL